jgi:uncharacterized protein YjiS (DUF1127 family)
MSMIPDARGQLDGSSLVFIGLRESILAWPRALARSLGRQRDREHLKELPDYLLRDIGIERFEIGSIVRCGGRDVKRRRRA